MSDKEEMSAKTKAKSASTQAEHDLEQLFSCRIGNCEAQMTAEGVFPHVKEKHKENLIDAELVGNLYNRWEFKLKAKYTPGQIFDYAFLAEDVGVFFITVAIEVDGNVLLDIQVANCEANKQFQFTALLCYPEKSGGKRLGSMIDRCLVTIAKLNKPIVFEKKCFRVYYNLSDTLRVVGMPVKFDVRVPK